MLSIRFVQYGQGLKFEVADDRLTVILVLNSIATCN